MAKAPKNKAEKYVTETRFKKFERTFEGSMVSIAKSFERVDVSLQRHEKVLEKILGELVKMNEENKYFRASISNLNIEGSSYDRRIEHLTTRVERLESKIK